MSVMQTGLPAHAAQAAPVIAELDALFSAEGIAIPGDGARVVLVIDGHHTIKYHRPGLLPAAPGKQQPALRFEGGEHTAIGDSAHLRFASDAPAIAAWKVPLHLPNGLSLSYGQIVALGGDFYGVPERPIADGATAEERVQRFAAAFDTLAALPASREEATKILAVMQREIAAANQAIQDGRQPHEAYDQLGDSLSEEWNRITGGGSVVSALFPLGRYLKLAASNWDHFGEWALLAYQAGHTAALRQALKARNSGLEGDLELAYAMNAFADHFLTDLFSSGHVRVPRKAIKDNVTPADLGSLISRFMHDEDSKYGLLLRNAQGDTWRGYGDKRYFDSVDVRNRQQVGLAVQRSVDEVFAAFVGGVLPAADQYAALRVAADLNAAVTGAVPGNFAALFALKNGKLMRRADVNNLNDTAQIDNWWGWSTYLLLKDYTPNKPVGFLEPLPTAPRLKADGWQSHTPSEPNWLPGHAVRYAVSVVNGLNESYIGPWSAYAELAEQFQPTLEVPVDSSGKSVARNLFRQFRGGSPELIASLDRDTTTYIDRHQ
ncbi:phospholipase [Pseudomonas sp. SDI]|uniref:phospholipase n=1 Tax=Pseudomonas sp. SDI TaxID=2170734 RepID=UPI000DE705D0|nr:phospholipase [Pseudomonas sp. SDI]PWB34934.1 phospholipase [Pseudomonas sp. SDI]